MILVKTTQTSFSDNFWNFSGPPDPSGLTFQKSGYDTFLTLKLSDRPVLRSCVANRRTNKQSQTHSTFPIARVSNDRVCKDQLLTWGPITTLSNTIQTLVRTLNRLQLTTTFSGFVLQHMDDFFRQLRPEDIFTEFITATPFLHFPSKSIGFTHTILADKHENYCILRKALLNANIYIRQNWIYVTLLNKHIYVRFWTKSAFKVNTKDTRKIKSCHYTY